MLYAANPVSNQWADLIDQGLDQDLEALIGVSEVLETLQRTLVLLAGECQ